LIVVAVSRDEVDMTGAGGGIVLIIPQLMLMLSTGDFSAVVEVTTWAIKITMSCRWLILMLENLVDVA
jgi:hypothetical protein